MAKIGMSFVKAKGLSDQRKNEFKEFIQGLDFKKDIYVLIYYNDDVSDVLVDYRRLDYLVMLNPDMELDFIEKRLFEKGVLQGSTAEHPNFKKQQKLITMIFPKTLDKEKEEELGKILKMMNLKINNKSFLDKTEVVDNKCLLYLNNFKDLVMKTLLEQIRWYIRTAFLPKELKISIENGKTFDAIDRNDYLLAFDQEDVKAMNACREKRQDIFNS